MKKQQISTAGPSQRRFLLDLPPELIRRILSFVPYDDASNDRLVCRTIDSFCKQYLNAGFKNVEHYHNRSLQVVKSQLPRRESERRNHSLARHNDILTAVETRLSLLSMTYNKYIDLSLCCFIPGKVLDETLRVLRLINNAINNNAEQPPRPHELLQELRDISSMAMEHFDEQVAPGLRDSAMHSPSAKTADSLANMALLGALRPIYTTTPSVLVRPAPASTQSAPPCRQQLEKLQIRLREQTTQLMVYKKDVASMRAAQSRTDAQLRQDSKKIQEQTRLIDGQNKKIDEMGKKFKQMGKKLLEYDNKLADLTSESNNGESSVGSSSKSQTKTPRSTRTKSRNTEKDDTVPEHASDVKRTRKRRAATAESGPTKHRKHT